MAACCHLRKHWEHLRWHARLEAALNGRVSCSRTIPCPKGTDRPACETVLLHREDFKIPEKMARFAVRHGMAGFVKKMSHGVHPFVEARRLRVDRVGAQPRLKCQPCLCPATGRVQLHCALRSSCSADNVVQLCHSSQHMSQQHVSTAAHVAPACSHSLC